MTFWRLIAEAHEYRPHPVHIQVRHIYKWSFLLKKSTTVLLLSHTASPRGMFSLFMTQPLWTYHTTSILQGFKHQEAPIQSLHHQEVHQTYNTGCNMDNDHRYGSLFTLMHAEYRVDIGYFMKNCKFASRVVCLFVCLLGFLGASTTMVILRP